MQNHHYIELEDAKGRKIKLLARTLMKLACSSEVCNTQIYVDWEPGTGETTLGLPSECLACGAPMERKWGKGQLTFVPEGESEFQDPHTGDLVVLERTDSWSSKLDPDTVVTPEQLMDPNHDTHDLPPVGPPEEPDLPEMRKTGDLPLMAEDEEKD